MNARLAYVLAGVSIATAAVAAVATQRREPPPRAPGALPDASAGEPSQALGDREPLAYYGPRFTNPTAYIPAQCYATTQREKPRARHNGCFVCHQAPREPNYVDDSAVQTQISFARDATENRWANLIEPPRASSLGDARVLEYVRKSNYVSGQTLTLAKKLTPPPSPWDVNQNGRFDGFVPDCWFHVDENGFDRDPSGRLSGWRSYAYLPVPGMFLPTNGSAGDAFIRLPEPFRVTRTGEESEQIYRINLAIVEAYIKRAPVAIPATDERELGADLDGDGKQGTARRVAFNWPAKPGQFKFVGKAAELDPKQDGWPVAGLYPRGTEFLHSVRYFDVVDGAVRMAARMKELRYMRKTKWLTYGQLDQNAQAEAREKLKKPDKLKNVFGDAERGVSTGVGWVMQAFIEDESGELRPQSFEEASACIGCHGGLGATTDATFSFLRKLPYPPWAGDTRANPAFRDGWFHPGDYALSDVPEPKRADGQGEYAHYLAEVGGADDFRSNDEVRKKFFRADGSLDPEMLKALARDVSLLLMPSPERALALNRAYLALVSAQHFERGRDVLLGTPQIERTLEQGASTGIESPVLPAWKRP